MAYHYYLSEKLAEAHRQDLLREAVQQRLVARLPRRRSLSRRVAHDLGVFLIKLGMWLKQRGEAVESDLYLQLALMRHLLFLSLRSSTCSRLSSSLAPLAHEGLMVITPDLNVATRQGQDSPSIVDGIRVVAASLTKAAIAEDGELLLFRPAFALGRRAAKQRFEFPGWHSQFKGKGFKKLGFGGFVHLQACQEMLHEIGLDLS